MQQSADAAPLVVQAERERAMQLGDQQHGLGRDVVGVGRDDHLHEILCYRETFCHCVEPYVTHAMLPATALLLCRAIHAFAIVIV